MFDYCDVCGASELCAKRGRKVDPYGDTCDEYIMQMVESDRDEYRSAWMKYISDFETIYA